MPTLKQLQEKGEEEFYKKFIGLTGLGASKKVWWVDDPIRVLNWHHQQITLAYNTGKAETQIEHCSEPECPECNLEAYNMYTKGREDMTKGLDSGDICVFNGTEFTKVKPKDVFIQVENARKEVLDTVLKEIEELKKDLTCTCENTFNGFHIPFCPATSGSYEKENNQTLEILKNKLLDNKE